MKKSAIRILILTVLLIVGFLSLVVMPAENSPLWGISLAATKLLAAGCFYVISKCYPRWAVCDPLISKYDNFFKPLD